MGSSGWHVAGSISLRRKFCETQPWLHSPLRWTVSGRRQLRQRGAKERRGGLSGPTFPDQARPMDLQTFEQRRVEATDGNAVGAAVQMQGDLASLIAHHPVDGV